MKRLTLLFALVTTMALAVASATAAAPTKASKQSGGAAGVVAAVVQVNDTLNDLTLLSNIGSIEVVTVKDSLNNVLQNATFLNNITILQNFLNNPSCSVVAVCNSLNDFLNDNNILITDVVAIDILSGGDVVVFQR